MDWIEVKDAFHSDGSLRDLYILDTDKESWEKFFSYLMKSGHTLFYTEDGQEKEIPSSVSQFLDNSCLSKSLSIDVNGVNLCCHFFDESEIELDLLPNEIFSQERLDSLLGFIKKIGSVLSKDIILTEENSPEYVWFKYESKTDTISYSKSA